MAVEMDGVWYDVGFSYKSFKAQIRRGFDIMLYLLDEETGCRIRLRPNEQEEIAACIGRIDTTLFDHNIDGDYVEKEVPVCCPCEGGWNIQKWTREHDGMGYTNSCIFIPMKAIQPFRHFIRYHLNIWRNSLSYIAFTERYGN